MTEPGTPSGWVQSDRRPSLGRWVLGCGLILVLVLAGVAVIGYADKPGKAQALAGVQAAAVTTDLAEITAALRNTA